MRNTVKSVTVTDTVPRYFMCNANGDTAPPSWLTAIKSVATAQKTFERVVKKRNRMSPFSIRHCPSFRK